MELVAMTSIICNLALLGLASWLGWGWLHKAEERELKHCKERDVDMDMWLTWIERLYHHLRKANKGNRRQNHLVKRVRRERDALVALLEMDGGKVRFNPSPEVGVLVLYPESLEMFETPDVGEEVVV